MKIFDLKNIYAGYGTKSILRDLDIFVEEGEFASIIGPNGAGKSTLLKVLSGEIAAASGTVLLRGKPISSYSSMERAREFSIVHQIHENMLPLTGYEFLRMGCFPHQKFFQVETDRDRESIEWSVKTTDIGDLIDRDITGLSGGELQLVHIAHALVQNRNVILLDEPISHLDIHHSVMIMDILHKLNRKGATILTVLHDINIASDYSSRIIGIKNGGIFFNGTPEKVLKYDLIEELFNTRCIVMENPTSGKPFVYPVPGNISDK